MKFQFGAKGNVRDQETYDATRGYGFEPAEGNVPWTRLSVRLPEGNYGVTARLGATDRASQTSVAAETRRLMLENVATTRGKFVQLSFIVNVRDASLTKPAANAPGGTAVRPKERELRTFTWDDKLTLQFIGRSSGGRRADRAGRSTGSLSHPRLHRDGSGELARGELGQILPRFMSDSVAVANNAESGETLKSFLTSLRLLAATRRLAADSVRSQRPKKQWPKTYVDAASTYRAYLRAYIAEARLRGAIPILVLPRSAQYSTMPGTSRRAMARIRRGCARSHVKSRSP